MLSYRLNLLSCRNRNWTHAGSTPAESAKEKMREYFKWRSCKRKRTYLHRKAAKAAAKRRNLRHYHCELCGYFHLTKQKQVYDNEGNSISVKELKIREKKNKNSYCVKCNTQYKINKKSLHNIFCADETCNGKLEFKKNHEPLSRN